MNVKNDILKIAKLTRIFKEKRMQSGSLSLQKEKLKFVFESEEIKGKIPVQVSLETKEESHELIEELMLLANKFTAELCIKHCRESALLRRHASPKVTLIGQL